MTQDLKDFTLRRWIPVIAGVLMQLCLGTVYIWGVFQPSVVKLFGWSQATAALTFSITTGFLVVGSTVGGKIQDKFSPKPVIMVGGVIMGIGISLAYFTNKNMPWWLWLTYGVIGGFGMGMTYPSIIACCQKWFPDKRGLITGIIVSAIGFGGLVFTPIARYIIDTYGVLEAFACFGLIFTIVCVCGAQCMVNPPIDYKPKNWTPKENKSGVIIQNFTPSQMLKTPQYYITAVTMMFACSAGMMVIPFAKIMGIQSGLSESVAALGVIIISIFNSCGRLFWGAFSDKFGRKNTIFLLLLIAGSCMLFVANAKMYVILVLMGVIAFSYGGFLGVFPVLTSEFWGVKNMGMNYGLVMIGFGVAGVASSYIAGYFKDLTGGFTIPFLVASICAFCGAVLIFFLKPPKAITTEAKVELKKAV